MAKNGKTQDVPTVPNYVIIIQVAFLHSCISVYAYTGCISILYRLHFYRSSVKDFVWHVNAVVNPKVFYFHEVVNCKFCVLDKLNVHSKHVVYLIFDESRTKTEKFSSFLLQKAEFAS